MYVGRIRYGMVPVVLCLVPILTYIVMDNVYVLVLLDRLILSVCKYLCVRLVSFGKRRSVSRYYVLLDSFGMELHVYSMSKPVLLELIGMEWLVLLLISNVLKDRSGMVHIAILFQTVL